MSSGLAVPKPTRKRRRRRDAKPRCSKHQCNRRIEAVELCKTHLVMDADAAFRRLIVERDGRCRACESRWRLQCAHIIRREFKKIRWDLANAVTLCSACHTFFTNRHEEWTIWVDEQFGEGAWAALRDRREAGEDWRPRAIELVREAA